MKIRRFGLFNFVMSNGDCLFAHASTLLHYIVRKAPFGKARLLDVMSWSFFRSDHPER